jgi:hypothetical protein
MSDRRHTAELLAKRVAECEAKKKALDAELARIYAAARAAGLSRADLKFTAARLAAPSSRKAKSHE